MRNNITRNLKYTQSTIWLMPMLRIPFSDWCKAGYVNSYVKDEKKNYGHPVILFACYAKERYAEALDDIITMLDSQVVDFYGYQNAVNIVVCKVPDEFMWDYHTIINGGYSNLSEAYKELVGERTNSGNKLYDEHVGKRLQLLIIEQNQLAKDFIAKEIVNMDEIEEGEIWPKFNFKNELLTENEIKNIIFTPFFKNYTTDSPGSYDNNSENIIEGEEI